MCKNLEIDITISIFFHFRYNGWSDPSMDELIANECRGVCGQVIESSQN